MKDAQSNSSPAKTLRLQDLPRAVMLPTKFQILVTCRDEADQKALFRQMHRRGRACRVFAY